MMSKKRSESLEERQKCNKHSFTTRWKSSDEFEEESNDNYESVIEIMDYRGSIVIEVN